MKRLTAFFKNLRLRQFLSIFLAGVLLVISTACSGANAQGANPNNPPVQAGGANNPYKSGGDGYNNLKISPDEKAHTSLQLNASQIIASSRESEILYPGAETPAGRAEKQAELPVKTTEDFQAPAPGGSNQRNADLGERVENRVEAVKEAFTEAGKFAKEKSDEAGARPEFQSNPALHK